MPKLSIIIPVYNVGCYLNKCIESVVQQTYKDWELILVDDGSKDESGRICDAWTAIDNRIVVYHIENSGVSNARNFGVKKASGEYLAFIDGDDWIDSQMYMDLIIKMEMGVDIAFCRFIREYTLENKSISHYETDLKSMETAPFDYSKIIYEIVYKQDSSQTLTNHVFGSVWRQLFRKTIIDKELIEFPKNICLAEDRLFLMQYLMYCRSAAVIDKYYYHYRIERKDSAVATMAQGYQKDLFDRRKQMLIYEFKLINENSRISADEKYKLIDYEKYKLTFDIVINEISHNPQYKNRLTILFKDDILKRALSLRVFKQIKKMGAPRKRQILCYLIKFRMWKTIKLLLKK